MFLCVEFWPCCGSTISVSQLSPFGSLERMILSKDLSLSDFWGKNKIHPVYHKFPQQKNRISGNPHLKPLSKAPASLASGDNFVQRGDTGFQAATGHRCVQIQSRQRQACRKWKTSWKGFLHKPTFICLKQKYAFFNFRNRIHNRFLWCSI